MAALLVALLVVLVGLVDLERWHKRLYTESLHDKPSGFFGFYGHLHVFSSRAGLIALFKNTILLSCKFSLLNDFITMSTSPFKQS